MLTAPQTPSILDDDILVEQQLRRALRSARQLTDSTLAVSVDGRRVAVAGCVPTRDAFCAVDRLARAHAGGREVLNLASVSMHACERDAARARELASRLRRRFSRSDLHVSVLGDTAVLTGRARTRRDRAEMATIAALEPAIERTVNQVWCAA